MYEAYDSSINENLREKIHLLPAWFCERMVSKDGLYAVVLDGGISVAINRITAIHQDTGSRIWIDVQMMPYAEAEIYLSNAGSQSRPIIGAIGESKKATINTASIMMAYEIGAQATETVS